MSGNSHHQYAQDAFTSASADADPGFNAAVRTDAQIQATLALAYEQRTANLIALMQTGNYEDVDGSSWGIRSDFRVQLHIEIYKRLGLGD